MPPDSFLQALETHFVPDRVIRDAGALDPYARDNKVEGVPPLAVVCPQGEDEVVRLVRLCREHHVPVVPRGAGTGTVGGAVPESRCVAVDLTRMNRVLEIHPGDMIARVEPGIVTEVFQAEVERTGLFYPPDPASADRCTIGGNVATNAGGLRAVKYGVTGDWVPALSAVLADGRVLRTGHRTRKGVVGYDLTHLFVGSEGTLGIITEITVRLARRPETRRTLIASFADLPSCARGVQAILAGSVIPSAIELVDAECVGAARTAGHLSDFDGPYLLIEVDGRTNDVMRDIAEIGALMREGGATVTTARDEAESRALWDARRALSDALRDAAPKKMSEDITVPLSRLVDVLAGVRELAAPRGLRHVSYGHAGDGNLHVNILYDPTEPCIQERVAAFRSDLFDLTLRLGGTMSGEHGVGIAKRPFIARELSPQSLAAHRAIKQALDPDGLMNPGKIW
ncbi:MAG: FAD-binding protein [Deltaproteobacteria bacterium]|nr:FAD-binding protein [Deltaproteobacteria bacterium]